MSLVELRDTLTALGISTSTDGVRGEERRLILQQRLQNAQRISEPELHAANTKHSTSSSNGQVDITASSVWGLTLGELRAALEARQLSTHTPGLKAEARRHALIQRLVNAGKSTVNAQAMAPVFEEEGDDAKSSRSSTSSYSAAGEFLYFDLPSAKSAADAPLIPALHLPNRHTTPTTMHSTEAPYNHEASDQMRQKLENELFGLRSQLHSQRSSRSKATSSRLHDAGFNADLDTLSEKMEQLESERKRLLRVAFGHELVVTSVAIAGKRVELVRDDATQLIEARQQQLRQQIQHTKDAFRLLSARDDGDNQEAELLVSIQCIEHQLRRLQGSSRTPTDSSRSSESLSSSSTPEGEGPVLTRCRSLPSHVFHETWRDLAVDEKQQLHQELRAATSFRIRRDRVCVVPAPLCMESSQPSSTRYFPTKADKLRIKALFLERMERSSSEVRLAYQQALALEPGNATVLTNYARFLHVKCGLDDEAEQLFLRATTAGTHSTRALAFYADFVLHTRRDLTKAREMYLRVLQVTPDDPQIMGKYANLLRKTANGSVSQLLEARELLAQALQRDAQHWGNRLCFCAVLEELGQSNDALREFELLVKEMESAFGSLQQPTSQLQANTALVTQAAHIYGNFANFLKRNGHIERARRVYVTALRMQPQDKLLLTNFSALLRDHKAQLRPTPRNPQ